MIAKRENYSPKFEKNECKYLNTDVQPSTIRRKILPEGQL